MKKLIVLFMLAATMFSCSDDDQQNRTTPFEGTWLLTYIGGGDRPEDHPEQEDVSRQNIRYISQGNNFKKMRQEETIDQGTFSYENLGSDPKGHYYKYSSKSQIYGQYSEQTAQIIQDTILIFTSDDGSFNEYRKYNN